MEKLEKLTNPKIMNILLESLTNLHRQQESKKKQSKKIMNLFSIKVQKYEDSSSYYRTDDNLNKSKSRKFPLTTFRFKQKNKKNIWNKHKSRKINKKDYNSNTNYDSQIDILSERFKNVDVKHDYNSDSSIYLTENKEKLLIYDEINNRFTKSLNNKCNKKVDNKTKLIKFKFNDKTKTKKFIDEDNIKHTNIYQLSGNELRESFIDQSLYNSYKSINSSDKKKSKEFMTNFYKNINEDKDMILYYNENDDNVNDNQYHSYYSLDNKSKIIYIKPSPKFFSRMPSLLESNIVSRKAPSNLSGEKSNITPKDDIKTTFDHKSIVEKLKYLEISMNDREMKEENLSKDEDSVN